MKYMALFLFIFSFNSFAVFDEDCRGKKQELRPFVESNEIILFSQMENAYEDAINVCRDVYSRMGDEKNFLQQVAKIESACVKAYKGQEYDEKFVDLLRCKVTKLYNL